MDAGLAAVLGAVIGSLGGITGGWLSLFAQGRQQARQVTAERQRWRDELRAEAYRTCIEHAKALSAAWWKAADALLDETGTDTEWQEAFVSAHDAWTRFSASVAAVTVAGPAPVAEAAGELRAALYAWEMVGTDWCKQARAQGQGNLPEHVERFHSAAVAKRSPDRAFQAAARQALATDA